MNEDRLKSSQKLKNFVGNQYRKLIKLSLDIILATR